MRKKRYIDTGFKGDSAGKTKMMAYENCKECYGHGYIGLVHQTGQYVACRCVKATELDVNFIEL